MEIKEQVHVQRNVLNRIKEHAAAVHESTKHEVMGYLLGRFKENIVEIHDIVIPKQVSTTVSVHEKDTDVELVNTLLQEEFQEQGIINVGWYHSHPGFGCFLSNVDLETQDVWQKVNPKMIALVIDNISGEFKVFRVKKTKTSLKECEISARLI